eukprot:10221324-Alexandrium_andersonii.AAC.1
MPRGRTGRWSTASGRPAQAPTTRVRLGAPAIRADHAASLRAPWHGYASTSPRPRWDARTRCATAGGKACHLRGSA